MNFPFKHVSHTRLEEASAPPAANRADGEGAREDAGGQVPARRLATGQEAGRVVDESLRVAAPLADDWRAAGPAWQPRHRSDAPESEWDARENRTRIAGGPGAGPGRDSHSSDAAAFVPRQVGGRGVEDQHSLDRLAALLRERQIERERRYAEPTFEEDAEIPQPSFGEAEETEDIGERFGWEERCSGEDVRQYLEAPALRAPRRRVTSKLAFAGAVVGVSAVAALFIVAPGEAPDASAPSPASQPASLAEQGEALTAGADATSGEQAAPATSPDTIGERGADPGPAPSMAWTPSAASEFRSQERPTLRSSVEAPAASGEAARVVEPMSNRAATSGTSTVRQVGPPSFVRSPPAEEPAAETGPAATDEAAEAAAPPLADPPQAEAGTTAETGTAGATPSEGGATSSAQATTDVNMRAGPDNGASVVTVIPANSPVELVGCDYWCEVIYEGQQGYVYRDFVTGAN